MALARIISRSQQGSRELALDLLARGYAVEIVSPDAIPDDLADLELCVEADTANQLIAALGARDGGPAASPDFVDHRKAPMGDIVRRPGETSEKVCFPAQPVSFNAEPGFAEDVELPSENWKPLKPARKLEILPDPEEGLGLITPPQQLLAHTSDLAKRAWRGLTITLHRSNGPRKSFIASQVWASSQGLRKLASQVWERAAGQISGRARLQSCRNYCGNVAGFSRRGLLWAVDLIFSQSAKPQETGIASSAGWFGRAAAIAFAAVLVVAIVLARGINRGGANSVNQDSPTVRGQTSATPVVNVLTNPEPERAVGVPTPGSVSEAKPAPISKTPRVHTQSEKSVAASSPGKGDDLVAPDTVTYFNKPTPAAPARDSSRSRASSHKRSGGTASAGTSPI